MRIFFPLFVLALSVGLAAPPTNAAAPPKPTVSDDAGNTVSGTNVTPPADAMRLRDDHIVRRIIHLA